MANIILPDTLSSAGNSAFKGCSSLKTLTIESGETSFDTNTFESCSSLAN